MAYKGMDTSNLQHSDLGSPNDVASAGAFSGKGLDYLMEGSKQGTITTAAVTDKTKDGSAASTTEPSWEDRRTAALLGNNLWLLAGVTSGPDGFAKEVMTDLTKMPQDKLNLVANLLEKSPYAVQVKRDANGNVESMAYNYDHPRWEDFKMPLLPFIIVAPQGLGMKLGRALNRGTGNDVTVTFKDGKATLEARQFWDITGRGYFHGGSHKITEPINRENGYKPIWLQQYCKVRPDMCEQK